MNEKKLLLVICALGYATSTMIKKRIEEFLDDKKVNDWYVETIGYNMSENLSKKASIIVSSLELNSKDYNVPLIDGVSLISGINDEETLEEIYKHIQEIDNK